MLDAFAGVLMRSRARRLGFGFGGVFIGLMSGCCADRKAAAAATAGGGSESLALPLPLELELVLVSGIGGRIVGGSFGRALVSNKCE